MKNGILVRISVNMKTKNALILLFINRYCYVWNVIQWKMTPINYVIFHITVLVFSFTNKLSILK